MNRDTWRPKVGERVVVTGHPSVNGPGKITSPGEMQGGWFWTNVREGNWVGMIHIRNLDPILEDERKGAPRPPVRIGEEVEIVLRAKTLQGCGEIEIRLYDCHITTRDPRVRQIERRKENKGREARR